MINIGTAGWSIPRSCADDFPAEGTSLERYAAQFGVVEVNSSFHRPHRHSTWERWRESVPATFRFSVKVPRAITHVRKLVDCETLVDELLEQASLLEDKLAVLLVQLPPKLQFDEAVANSFFALLADRTRVRIACEPRNIGWFTAEADTLLRQFDVARVAVDPALNEIAASPGGSASLSYWRLHGSPVIYRSSYRDRVAAYAKRLEQEASAGREVWCVFDNTASSAGAADALELKRTLRLPKPLVGLPQ